ncbi:class I SAM-dependent methyltransferase [bacterium]|nr:class I SAM-dependent methyltransferase [bacterium]
MKNNNDLYGKHYSRLNRESKSTFIRSSYKSELWFLKDLDRSIKILDLGCGQGILLRYLCYLGFTSLTGVDISSSQLEAAEKTLPDSVRLEKDSAIDFLGKNRNAFDLIISYDILEHIQEDLAPELLELVFGSLKTHGRAIFRTPNMGSLLGIYSRYIDITHKTGYTEYSLMQLLDASPFSGNYKLFAPSYGILSKKWFAERLNFLISAILFKIQFRSIPRFLDKNLLAYAEKRSK